MLTAIPRFAPSAVSTAPVLPSVATPLLRRLSGAGETWDRDLRGRLRPIRVSASAALLAAAVLAGGALAR